MATYQSHIIKEAEKQPLNYANTSIEFSFKQTFTYISLILYIFAHEKILEARSKQSSWRNFVKTLEKL